MRRQLIFTPPSV